MVDDGLVDIDLYRERRPPSSILILAMLAVGAAFALLMSTRTGAHIAGYLLGSFFSVGLVALFMKIDNLRRKAPDTVYRERRNIRSAWSTVLVLGIVVGAVHAWQIAAEVAVR